MTSTFSVDELRGVLAEHAEEVSVPPGLSMRAVDQAGRVRRNRRIVGASVAVVTSLAVLTPLVLHTVRNNPPEPAETPSAPAVTGSLEWSASLPGLQLPTGAALSVPYAVESSVFFDGSEHPAPGALAMPPGTDRPRVIQVLDTPEGVVAVTQSVLFPVHRIHLFEGDNAESIGGTWALNGLLALGLGRDGQPHIAFSTDLGEATRTYAGPVTDLQEHAAATEGLRAVGFLDGDPLFAQVDQLTQLIRISRDPVSGDLSESQVGDDGALALGQSIRLAGLAPGEPDLALYTDTETGCTSAYGVPGLEDHVWQVCNDSRGVMNIGPRYGAVGNTVYDLATADAVRPSRCRSRSIRSDGRVPR